MGSAGELAGGDADVVGGGATGEESADGVGEEIAGGDVVGSAGGEDVFCRVGGAAAEVVFAIGADAEVGGVAVETGFETGFDNVAGAREGDQLAGMDEVAVSLHDGAGGRVEGLKGAIVELDGGGRCGWGWESQGCYG